MTPRRAPVLQIGQQFSTRVDVLSPELIKELEKLQDRVPPFGSKAAVKIIEEQLGGPLDTHFQDFELQPIAAASLGQVHRARLNGRRVVVKVQRPGLRELFEIDLKNLRCAISRESESQLRATMRYRRGPPAARADALALRLLLQRHRAVAAEG